MVAHKEESSSLTSAAEAKEYLKRHDRVRGFDVRLTKIHSVAWNCDGSRLACGSQDKSVSVAALENSKLKCIFLGSGHTDQVDQVAWNWTNPDLLASASGDKSIRVWDLRQKKTQASLSTKSQNINVVWSPCGTYIVYGDKDDKLHLVDMRVVKTLHTEAFKQETNEFAFEHSGQFMYVASGLGRVFIYKMPEMKLVKTLQAHPSQTQCLSIKVDPTSEYFAVGAADALISIWDVRELICVRTIDRLDWPVRAVAFSHDGQILAAGSEDHVVDIAWTETGERVYELKSDAETYTLAWHPRQYLLAAGSGADYREREPIGVKLFGLTD
uniref:Translation initiation factor beta propellor-like domain-containing protein n=1 Tax=Plectus sambesii TaxID=2011161 RepID=A0A914XIJ5_9BILA